MYNKYEQKITDINDVSFWLVDSILFQEYPFSSSSNNHLTWQCSIYLCTCAPSPKCFPLYYLCSVTRMSWWKRFPCSSLTAPQFNGKKSRYENKKCIFSDILHPSCSTESIRSFHNLSEICSFEMLSLSRSGVVNSTVVTLMPNILPYFFGSSRSLMRSLSLPCVILWLEESVLGK